MDSKIRELTDKIYNEGVQKGTLEGERILAEARAEAEAIISRSKEEIQRQRERADREIADKKAHAETDLQLFAGQVVEAVKGSVADLVTGRVVEETVSKVTADEEFLKKMILEFVRSFDQEKGLVISTSQAQALHTYFEAHAKELLDKGVEIKQVNGQPTEFAIEPKGGGYKIVFGHEQFIELFKSFLRPEMGRILFADKK